MDTMGTVYTSLGLYDAAIPLVRKAYRERMQLWGTRQSRDRRAASITSAKC